MAHTTQWPAMCFLCSPVAAFSQGTGGRNSMFKSIECSPLGCHSVPPRPLVEGMIWPQETEICFEKSSTVVSPLSLTVPQRHFILILQEVAEALRYYAFKIKTLKLQCDDFQIFQASLPLALIVPLLFLLQSYLLFEYAVLVQCCSKALLLCSKKSFSLRK